MLKWNLRSASQISSRGNTLEISRHRCAVCSPHSTSVFPALSLHQSPPADPGHGEDQGQLTAPSERRIQKLRYESRPEVSALCELRNLDSGRARYWNGRWIIGLLLS